MAKKKELMVSIVIGTILIVPIIKFLFSPQASLRYKEVNIFTNIGVVQRTNQEIINANNSLWAKIINNRRVAYGVEYVRHYFDNLNPNFLFIKGDGNPKFSTQDVGQMYIWDILFFTIGILYLIKEKRGHWWLVPSWLLIGIIPAATARETPHALRIETTLPMFQIFTAYGLVIIAKQVADIKAKIYSIKVANIIYTLISLFLLFNTIYYLHGYYSYYPKGYSGEWQYGYKDSINFVNKIENNFDQIDITDNLGRPYIYYLFYTKTSPDLFRTTSIVKRDVFGFVSVQGYGKYRFGKDLITIKSHGKRILYIDIPGNIPNGATIIDRFKLLNGDVKLIAYIK